MPPDATSSAISQETLNWLLILGSALATFVASVMADEQSERLKNGAFGAVAGTSIGGLAGLMKNQPDLVILGFFGSVVGACAGWVVYFAMSWLASNPKYRTVLDFLTGGLKAVKESLYVDSPATLIPALKVWCDDFSAMARKEKNQVLSIPQDGNWARFAKTTIETWLTTVVDTLALVFRTLARKPQYQSRVTVIVYGTRGGKIMGRHWIHYEGDLTPYRTSQDFDDTSIGYKVLSGLLPSPYFTTTETAQTRGQRRADDPAYRPFITFRINDNAILALDWPENLAENDPYVIEARDFFNRSISPLVAEVLDRWPGPLAEVVGLEPLPVSTSQSATKAGTEKTNVLAATGASPDRPAPIPDIQGEPRPGTEVREVKVQNQQAS